VLIGLVAVVTGLYLSFHLDLPAGPTIVLVATGLFLLALLLSPSRGLVAYWRRPRPAVA
jgi:manganese/iron transport system permease protein